MLKHIGVLLSGRGSNFEALAESVSAGRIPGAEIAVVISNREGAPGIERAKRRGIEARVIPSKGLEREAYDRQVAAALQEKDVDLVCLAGYMRLLSPYFVAEFPHRILNIHPSLLPAFPGLEAQRQALEFGVKVSGCTVHFVDENLDAGPILLQVPVPVLDKDTVESLSERILKEEHRIYSEAVRIVLEAVTASRAAACCSLESKGSESRHPLCRNRKPSPYSKKSTSSSPTCARASRRSFPKTNFAPSSKHRARPANPCASNWAWTPRRRIFTWATPW